MTNAELDDRLGELLMTYQVVTRENLDRARSVQAAKRSTLPGALVGLHLVPDETIAPLLEELKQLISQRASAQEIRARSRAEGMRTLRDAALAKVAAGETSIAEVLEHTVAHTLDSSDTLQRTTVDAS